MFVIMNNTLLDITPLDELKRGFVKKKDENGNQLDPVRYVCLYCGSEYEQGIIYNINSLLVDAERAARMHVLENHDGPFHALLNLDKNLTGLSEVQTQLLSYLYDGYSDAEIAQKMGGKAESTIRNHRFHLRKRNREAKILHSLMENLDQEKSRKNKGLEDFYTFAAPVTVEDDRIIVTQSEARRIFNKYIEKTADGVLKLKRFPKKQKEKLVVLDRIVRQVELDREYSEREINELLKNVDDDYVTLRRYLIDYGLLRRTPGGKKYRRTSPHL